MKKIKVECEEMKPSRIFDLIYDDRILYASIKLPNWKKAKVIKLNDYLRQIGVLIECSKE